MADDPEPVIINAIADSNAPEAIESAIGKAKAPITDTQRCSVAPALVLRLAGVMDWAVQD
jgi:hypothetical protein